MFPSMQACRLTAYLIRSGGYGGYLLSLVCIVHCLSQVEEGSYLRSLVTFNGISCLGPRLKHLPFPSLPRI